MSVVAAKVYEDKIELACDSALTYGGRTQLRVNSLKLFQFDGLLMAGAGSPDDFSLMKHFTTTEKPAEPEVRAVMDFFMNFRTFAQEKGRDIMPDNNAETDYVMVFEGKCFSIEGFHVREITDFHAFGDGMDLALGALHVGAGAEEAVRVACYYNIYCMEPVNAVWAEKRVLVEA